MIVIGGLAVVCRLSTPYRATIDLDTLNRRTSSEPAQLQLLLDSGATTSGASGVLVPTTSGPVQVDVLEVTDAELERLPVDPTDRLHVLAHAWAAATATPLTLRVDALDDLIVKVATPGPLIAMKLQSVMNRGAHKEATDLLDILRLTLDRVAGPTARAELELVDTQLREDAARHARLWFLERAARTLRIVRQIPEGVGTDPDDIQLVGELLLESLHVQH